MEKCEIDVPEESKTESKEYSLRKLGKHLGKLLFILELFGIPIFESRFGSRFLDLLQKLCFPIFIHLSMIYLLYGALSHGLSYAAVIDTALPILTCMMWIILRSQKASLDLFLADLSRITSNNFKSRNRKLAYSTNAAICFIFIYPLLLFGMRFAQGNIINTFEVFRILQEAIFPVTMVVVYVSICCLLLQKLQFCKKTFQKRLDLACSSAMDMMKDYLNVVKSVESFENLLSNIIFVVLLHDFCTVTILIIDMFVVSDWMAIVLYEALCELLYVLFSFMLMATCAGNVSQEMAEIKSVLVEKAFTRVEQGDLINNEKQMNLLLKKDVCVLTVGKALVFNRGLILKLLLIVFVEVIVICEILPFSSH